MVTFDFHNFVVLDLNLPIPELPHKGHEFRLLKLWVGDSFHKSAGTHGDGQLIIHLALLFLKFLGPGIPPLLGSLLELISPGAI